MTGPYTGPQMSAEIRADDAGTGRFDSLYAEAKSALGYAANTLRALTEQYREAYHADLASWHTGHDELDDAALEALAMTAGDGIEPDAPARSGEVRRTVALGASELGERATELSRLELAVRGLERTWLFVERGDASLQGDPSAPDLPDDLRMRLVEAREAERVRLAQEIHDGPAQALSNAIFQADYIERVLDTDPDTVRTELRVLRERLRRELDDVRSFITQLRPPLLAELGLDGSIEDSVATMRALIGAMIETDLAAPAGQLSDEGQVVVLRVMQEALQNVRRHAEASSVRVRTHLDDDAWVLEVADDGRGFDVDAVSVRGRRNFGLQFMRDRAELIGARFEVQSRPAGGTLVRLAIPVGTIRR
jgi:two-component system, NarL family, sensor histidine kinase DegS